MTSRTHLLHQRHQILEESLQLFVLNRAVTVLE